MGGNVTARNKRTGEEISAEKINIDGIGRGEFVKVFTEVFKKMNQSFAAKYGHPIWDDLSHLDTGFMYNGSTSYIMNPEYSDEEVVKYKPSAGDLDIAVPESIKAELFGYLDSIEGKNIIPGVKYMGSNKPTVSSIGDQINSVVLVQFSNGIRVPAQVDFEFLPFVNGKPTTWAKFSHSSSFEDAKAGTTTGDRGIVKLYTDGRRYFHSPDGGDAVPDKLIISALGAPKSVHGTDLKSVTVLLQQRDVKSSGIKAVHHKYLIRALVGGASVRDDIVIATGKSTWDNPILTKSKTHAIPRMLKFSVGRGIRTAYTPLLDPESNPVYVGGKQVYKEIPSKSSTYETVVENIYRLSFGQLTAHPADVKLFDSFVGVLTLMKKFLNRKQIKNTVERYMDLLWSSTGQRGQELEVNDPVLDFRVKMAGYQKLVKVLGVKNESTDYVSEYYGAYGRRGRGGVSENEVGIVGIDGTCTMVETAAFNLMRLPYVRASEDTGPTFRDYITSFTPGERTWNNQLAESAVGSIRSIIDAGHSFTVVIGGVASGKSTFIEKNLHGTRVVDVDAFTAEMSGGDHDRARKLVSKGLAAVNAELKRVFKTGESVINTCTGASTGGVLKKLALAKAAGYSTTVVLVSVPLKTALARNSKRAESGDRNLIPEYKVKRTNDDAKNNFKIFASAADNSFVVST